MESESKPPIELGYAPPLPWYQHRRVRRIAEVIAALLLLGAIALWAPCIFRFIDSRRWDMQCRKWEQPPSIIFDSVKYAQTPNNPVCWQHYLRYTFFIPTTEQLIYLHARRSESGRERLVAVYVNYDQFRRIYIETRICGPRDWHSPSEQLREGDLPLLEELVGPFKPFLNPNSEIQIYSGQSDPTDESHFTFDCKMDGHRRTIDGWLRSDDTVLIEPRREITPPPPSSAALSH